MHYFFVGFMMILGGTFAIGVMYFFKILFASIIEAIAEWKESKGGLK